EVFVHGDGDGAGGLPDLLGHVEGATMAGRRGEGRGRHAMSDIVLAASLLRDGRLVAFPTETVYGLGADASNAAAVRRIFAAKGRPADHPVIVHLASAEAMTAWARAIPASAHALAAAFWPGPLTLIVPRAP